MGLRGRGRARLMRRGDIYLTDFDLARTSEVTKRRPAVIVSNDGANGTAERLGTGVVTVVPVTSTTDRVYAFQIRLPASSSGLDRDSKVQAEQIRSVSIERLVRRVGSVPTDLMAELDEALRLHLSL